MSPLVTPNVGGVVGDIAKGIAGSSGREKKFLGMFESTSYGPPWNTMNGTGVTSQGTNLQGKNGVGKYIVAVDPTIIPYGTKLNIMPNPFGDPNIAFLADDTGGAFQGGVKAIDFFDWRGRQAQLSWGRRQVKVWQAGSGGSGAIGAVGGAADVVADTGDFVGDFVGTILNFRKLGELGAKATAWFIRLVGKAIWEYVIAPLLSWNQRAVTFYWDRYFSRRRPEGGFLEENGGVISLMFWGMGYGILWAKADGGVGFADSPHQTMLGRTVRSVESQISRRRLVKPGKVRAKTPPKPKPTVSEVSIEGTSAYSANRRRPVRVSRNGQSNGSDPRRPIPATA